MIQKNLAEVLLFVFLVIALGCNKKSAVAKADQPEEIVETTEEEIVEADSIIVEEPVIEINTEDEDAEDPIYVLCELKRTSCFGKCPSYSIKLFSDGRATYHGKSNVDRIGQYQAFILPQDFEPIFEAATKANYFVFRSQYPKDGRTIPDLPKTITYLKKDGLEKRIINNYEAPKALLDFESWLDTFFDSLEWELEK